MTTIPVEFNSWSICVPARTPVGDPKFKPGFTLTVAMTEPLLVSLTLIPDALDGRTMAQVRESVPVDQPLGCVAPRQEESCRRVLNHIDPTAVAPVGGTMLPPDL